MPDLLATIYYTSIITSVCAVVCTLLLAVIAGMLGRQ